MYLSRGDGFREALERKMAAKLVGSCLMKDFKKIKSSDRLVMVGLSGMLQSLSQAPLLLNLALYFLPAFFSDG